MTEHVGPVGLAATVVVLAALIVVVRAITRESGIANTDESPLKHEVRSKKVVIRAEDGTEHAASLSIEGIDDMQEALDAIADLMAEVLDIDISTDEASQCLDK